MYIMLIQYERLNIRIRVMVYTNIVLRMYISAAGNAAANGN